MENTIESSGRLQLLYGEQHIHILRKLITDLTQREAIIECPWIRGEAAAWLARQLPQLVSRGVDVHVIYGYNGLLSDDNDERLVNLIRRIIGIQNLHLMKEGTHAKTIVCDRRIAVVGSWNWLSNSYHLRYSKNGCRHIHPPQRREASIMVTGAGASVIAAQYIDRLHLTKSLDRLSTTH